MQGPLRLSLTRFPALTAPQPPYCCLQWRDMDAAGTGQPIPQGMDEEELMRKSTLTTTLITVMTLNYLAAISSDSSGGAEAEAEAAGAGGSGSAEGGAQAAADAEPSVNDGVSGLGAVGLQRMGA